ncbi:MAG TPA: acyl carrier protein [Methylomirabilota bacterium]|jgi:acyl carrier protein|nr:acyl carrier protein [Methylomirabilota bacterium]
MSTGNPPAGLEQDAVAFALTAFVNEQIMARGREIRPEDDFELMGVDSMALLKVLLFVEAEFGFWMPDEDLVADNLRSPRSLADYICRRRGLS